MVYDILGTGLGAVLLLGTWFLLQRHWRGQALACAAAWAREQGLMVADWSAARFQMDRQRPALTFVASSLDAPRVDVKLRLRIAMRGAWQVDEVAYCLPTGVAEDDMEALAACER